MPFGKRQLRPKLLLSSRIRAVERPLFSKCYKECLLQLTLSVTARSPESLPTFCRRSIFLTLPVFLFKINDVTATHILTIILTCHQSGRMVLYTVPVRRGRTYTKRDILNCSVCRRNGEPDHSHAKCGTEMGEAAPTQHPYDHPWHGGRSSYRYRR